MRVWGLLGVSLAALGLSGCAPEVTQRFTTSPSATYNAFEAAWGQPTKKFVKVDGQNVPVVVDINKVEGKSLEAVLTLDGKVASEFELTMVPAADGKETDVKGHITIDSARFWQATDEGEGPEISELQAGLALKSMLNSAAQNMKESGSIGFGHGNPFSGMGASARSASADHGKRERDAERQAAAATRPMTSTQGAQVSGSDVSGSAVSGSTDATRPSGY